jgi:hypothetical protein
MRQQADDDDDAIVAGIGPTLRRKTETELLIDETMVTFRDLAADPEVHIKILEARSKISFDILAAADVRDEIVEGFPVHAGR